VAREEGIKIDRMTGKTTNPGHQQVAVESDKDQVVFPRLRAAGKIK
jgi:hypothetical protein